MPKSEFTAKQWSKFGLEMFIASFIGAVLLTFAEGFAQGSYVADAHDPHAASLRIWCYGLRMVAEQLILPSALLAIAGKYFETRHIISIGFDKKDSHRMVVKPPGDDNIVWIGQRYDSKYEARPWQQ